VTQGGGAVSVPPLLKKGTNMKCKIFASRDWDVLEELITGFIANKKIVDMRQSVVKAGFFDNYHLLVITIIYKEE